jgi:hypothetical protein
VPTYTIPATATNANAYGSFAWTSTTDFWVETFRAKTFVLTTNTGSAFWTCTLGKTASNGTVTTVGSFTTAADSPSVWVNHDTAIGALLGTSSFIFEETNTKTSTPGNLYSTMSVVGRLVG